MRARRRLPRAWLPAPPAAALPERNAICPTVARFLLAGGWIRPTSMSESPFLLQKRSFDAKCQQPPDDAIHEITTTLSKLIEVDPSLPFVQKLDSGPVPSLTCPDEAHSFAGRPQLKIRERVSLGS